MLVRLSAVRMRIPDAGDAVGNGDARQASAVMNAQPDAGDAVGNGDARQASAAIECVIPMLVTLLGMVTLVRQCSLECASPDAGDAVGMMHLESWNATRCLRVGCCCQACSMNADPDAGDAVGNVDARQASAVIECVIPMLVTLSGMVMLVRLLQSWNALSRCW